MNICLFEDEKVSHLFPVVETRPVYDLLIGMRSIGERLLSKFGDYGCTLHSRRHVLGLSDLKVTEPEVTSGTDILFMNGRILELEKGVADFIKSRCLPGQNPCVFVQGDDLIAAWMPHEVGSFTDVEYITRSTFDTGTEECLTGIKLINHLWEIITEQPALLIKDFEALTRGSVSHEGSRVQEGAILASKENIHISIGASIRPGAILNAEDGPIYIDENAVIYEGAIIRGPSYVGPHTIIRSGADIELCSFGYNSKVGGEVFKSIFHSLSNKPHEGFLGCSYVGRWCNIGADSNASNLKNDYGPISLFNKNSGEFEETGEQFLGLFMGDHSKCAITSMFNTGTIIGVSCNLFGAGFHPKYIPSFKWGGPDSNGFIEYRLEKALEVAQATMARRGRKLTEKEKALLVQIHNNSLSDEVRWS